METPLTPTTNADEQVRALGLEDGKAGVTEVVERRQRKGLSAKKRAFLAAYALQGTITSAAEAAGVSRQMHQKWMRKDNYRVAFEAAYEEFCEKLELEAIRRAHDGWDEPVYQGGELVGHKRKFSDALIQFLLKGAKPDKYRDNQKIEHAGDVGISPVMILPANGTEPGARARTSTTEGE